MLTPTITTRTVLRTRHNLLKHLPSRPTLIRTFYKTLPHMSSYKELIDSGKLITAYVDNLPDVGFEQKGPGLDERMPVKAEHSKLEHWDDEGRPFLKEYVGSGKLENKIALLTGADSGIGRAAAIMFAREGASLSIACMEAERKDAEAVKAEIESSEYSKGAKVNLIFCDLSIPGDSEAKRVIEEHKAAFGGKLNVLVNNAAQQVQCMDIQEIDMDTVQRTLQINIAAMFALTKHALPMMKRGSAIINTTSVTAYKGSGGFADYAATKGAILSFTRSLAVQLASKGIRANSVAPGPFYTPLQPAARPEDQMEGFAAGGPPLTMRAGQPAECGPAYVYLASADSNFVSGSCLALTGGDMPFN